MSARKRELTGGGLLFGAALLALLFANTPLVNFYTAFLNIPFHIQLGASGLTKPLSLWINDGLMTLFFLLIALDLKREFLQGDLAKPSQVALPAIAALGGMVIPALIFTYFNAGDPAQMRGWAIPVATDIAFVLGTLALLGPRIPNALRSFLLALAIFDDMGAIIIIAIFYTEDVSLMALMLSGLCLVTLFVFNRLNIRKLTPYMLVGFLMWGLVLNSGVHATLAGVALGLLIPHHAGEKHQSPMLRLEHFLQPWVIYFIVPLFAFVNAGLTLSGMSSSDFTSPVTLGIAFGLLFGKQIGVFSFTAATIKLGLAPMPHGTHWASLFAGATLCGIGFTMSLFISSLAFQGVDIGFFEDSKLGILMGSLASGLIGYYLLKRTNSR